MTKSRQGGQSEGNCILCERQWRPKVETVEIEKEGNGPGRHFRGKTESVCRWIKPGQVVREMVELSMGDSWLGEVNGS